MNELVQMWLVLSVVCYVFLVVIYVLDVHSSGSKYERIFLNPIVSWILSLFWPLAVTVAFINLVAYFSKQLIKDIKE